MVRRRRELLLFVLGFTAVIGHAQVEVDSLPTRQAPQLLSSAEDTLSATAGKKPSRALAAALAVGLGPFGGHRVYLGTGPKVPLVYSLTFGGFGVLAVIDLGHVLFTKDLRKYQESERVFMWAKPRTQEAIPP